MRRVAAALGVSATKLYELFPGKDSIAVLAQIRATQKFTETLLDGPGSGRDEALAAFVERYFRFAFENPWEYHLIMRAPLPWDQLDEDTRARLELLDEVARGHLGAEQTGHHVVALFATLHGFVQTARWWAAARQVSTQELVQVATDYAARSLRSG